MANYTRPIFSWPVDDLDNLSVIVHWNSTIEGVTINSGSADLAGYSVNSSGVPQSGSVIKALLDALDAHSQLGNGGSLLSVSYTINDSQAFLLASFDFSGAVSTTPGVNPKIDWTNGGSRATADANTLARRFGFTTSNGETVLSNSLVTTQNHDGYWSPTIHGYQRLPFFKEESHGSQAGWVISCDNVIAAEVFTNLASREEHATPASRDTTDTNNTFQDLISAVASAKALTWWEADETSDQVYFPKSGPLDVDEYASDAGVGTMRYNVNMRLRI